MRFQTCRLALGSAHNRPRWPLARSTAQRRAPRIVARLLALVVALGLLVGGCEKKTADAQGPEASGDPAALFSVSVEAPPLAAGAEGVVTFTLRPAAGLKWNVEYPTAFRAKPAPGAAVESLKPKVRKGDSSLAESEAQAVLRWPVRALRAGNGPVTVLASFSVCTASACHIVRDRALEAAVTVR